MMKQFLFRLRWEAVLLSRNNLLTISVVVTAVYMGLFQLLKLVGEVELVSLVVVLNDPALIGMLFIGITVIFDREQGTLSALRVAPMNFHHYLLAKVGILSVLGTLCGYGMALASVGTDLNHIHFLLALLLTSIGFANLGIGLVARTRQFVTFALYVAGGLLVMFVPLLKWFAALEIPGIELFPLEHSLRLLAWSYGYQEAAYPVLSYAVLLVFAAGTYFWAHRRFLKSI